MSKLAKRISAACVALVLAVCLFGSTLALTACSSNDFKGLYASATFGVTLIVGQNFTLSNCNVYGQVGKEADSENDLCIAGMRADSESADTVVLLDADGKETDAVKITSSSQDVTLQYTGEKYSVSESKKTFTYTLSAKYATSAEVVPYTVGRSGAPETLAVVGDGSSAMSVIVYYDGGSDTHADNTITVSNSTGGSVLATGLNTITATSVCETTSGAVAVSTVYLNIVDNDSTTTTYTAYSDEDLSSDSELYSYTVFADTAVARVKAVADGDNRLSAGDNISFAGSVAEVAYDAFTQTYTVSGVSGTMSEEQANAFWDSTEEGEKHVGHEYIAIEIIANSGEAISITAYNGSTVQNTWTMHGTAQSGDADGVWVVDVTPEVDGDFRMEVEVTYSNQTSVTYTIVLGTFTPAASADSE